MKNEIAWELTEVSLFLFFSPPHRSHDSVKLVIVRGGRGGEGLMETEMISGQKLI